MPGEASLAAAEYYAHPQNQFWRLVGAAIEIDLATLDYDERLAALRNARIGLWDTIASATRVGSLDAAIRDAALAPLAKLAASLPALRAIGFNGATAARIGRKTLGATELALIDLPSSSPAFAAMHVADKAERWKSLRQILA